MKATSFTRNGLSIYIASMMIAAAAQASNCQVSATSVNFGSFSPLSLNVVDSTGNISVNCTDVTGYSIVLSAGNGDYHTRRLLSSSDTLDYNLYRDAAHQQIWGDGSSGDNYAVTAVNPVSGFNYIYTVHGRIYLIARRGIHVGTYTDNIAVVVNY